MGRPKKKRARRGKEIKERDLEGFKLLKPVSDLLAALRDESNPNRDLHFDHYVTLLLFHFFNPVLTSLRGLQAATEFPQVRKKLGVPRASLGSLSAAQHVFDPDQLGEVFAEVLKRLPADKGDARLAQIKEIVTVADGTLLKALPRVAWALWINDKKRAVKAHVQLEVLKGAPSRVDVTAGSGCARTVFREALEPGRLSAGAQFSPENSPAPAGPQPVRQGDRAASREIKDATLALRSLGLRAQEARRHVQAALSAGGARDWTAEDLVKVVLVAS